MGVIGWVVLGLIAASLERSILRRSGGTFIGSLALAWAGAALGGLLAAILGWGDVTDLSLRSLAIATAGIVIILGGIRLAQQFRSRPSEHAHPPNGPVPRRERHVDGDAEHSQPRRNT